MSIRAGVVVAVALHEIDNASNAKTSPKSDNKCFQNAYCGSKKCHDKILSAACAAVRPADKRRSAFGRRRIKKPPCDKGGVPTLRKFCGAAVFSCKGLGATLPGRGAYQMDAPISLVDVPGGEKVDERIYEPLMEMLNDAEDLGPIVEIYSIYYFYAFFLLAHP